MYGCESKTIKKAECQRIDAFELWCWRRLLRVPRTARRSNQSILKQISPEYSLQGLLLKLKLQYFDLLMASFPEYLTFWGDSAFHPVLCSYQHFNIAPLDCKEIKPVHPKGNQLWIFIGRTDVEIEVPVLWPPDVKSRFIGKDLEAGKEWRQKDRGQQRMK